MFLKVNIFYLCFNYFIVKNNVLQRTVGPYPQLTHTVQRWRRESRVGRGEQSRQWGVEQAGESRAGSGGVEQARGSRAGRGKQSRQRVQIFEKNLSVLIRSYHHYFLFDFQNLNSSNTTETQGIFLENFSSLLYKLTLLHLMKVRCRQNEKIVKDFRDT